MNRRYFAAILIALLTTLAGCITEDFGSGASGAFGEDATSDVAAADASDSDDTTDASGEPCSDAGTCENGAANQTGVCLTSGTCKYRCQDGYADCDGDSANGCEVNLNTSIEHCRECNESCDLSPNQYLPICTEEGCDIDGSRCLGGWKYIDGQCQDCETSQGSEIAYDGVDTDCDGEDNP